MKMVLVGAIVAVSVASPSASARTESQGYLLGFGGATYWGTYDFGQPGVGGAHFDVLPGETTVTVTGDGDAAGFDVSFYTEGRTFVDSKFMCAPGSATFAMPSGTTEIIIFAGTDATNVAFYGELCGAVAPVQGTITATFS